jgi:pimeloyl-ACP methyl ester carboxylesterase
MNVQPFEIRVPQTTLDDLRARLARTRWPGEVAGAAWETGTDLRYLQDLVAYWRDRYDWRAQEAYLNSIPQFRADVDGMGLHFIHVRGTGPDPMPLILTHGWPSTIFEYLKLVPLLTDPARFGADPADAFDVVAPSLPGYGFSDRPTQPGATRRIPDLWVKLMTEVLAYPRFAAHGADIGGYVTNRLGLEHPEKLIGIHVVNELADPYVGPGATDLTEREQAFLAGRQRTYETGQAYAHLQRTKPQTLSYGLNDSPAGLAAWIVEKWHSWSDCGGDLERRFTKDELLTTVTIYWVTESIGSSFRVYADWALGGAALPDIGEVYPDAPKGNSAAPLGPGERIPVPSAVAIFPGGGVSIPREWVERAYDLKRWTVMPRGGHFAAMEEPELLVEDIRTFFRTLR